MKVSSVTLEIKDWIGDELAWTVPGRFSSAVDLKDWMRKIGGSATEARLIACVTDCINRLMFEQQELLATSARQIFAD